jgi:hypothetical protein
MLWIERDIYRRLFVIFFVLLGTYLGLIRRIHSRRFEIASSLWWPWAELCRLARGELNNLRHHKRRLPALCDKLLISLRQKSPHQPQLERLASLLGGNDIALTVGLTSSCAWCSPARSGFLAFAIIVSSSLWFNSTLGKPTIVFSRCFHLGMWQTKYIRNEMIHRRTKNKRIYYRERGLYS